MNENFISTFEYYKNASLKKYNTYRLDVMCEYLIYPKNIEELLNLLKYIKENSDIVTKSGLMVGLGETEAELEKMSKDQLAVQVYQLFNSNLPGILSALPQVEKMMGTLDIMPQMQQYMLYSQYMSMTGMLNQLFLAGIPQTFTMQAGDISPVLPVSEGAVLVMVEKRIPSDMKDFAKNKAALLKQLRSAKEQMAIQEFHENVMRQCSYTLETQAPQNGTEAIPAK